MTSLIIPVHNGRPWLDECLKSALASSAGEIIVIDDASDDGINDILAACQDERLRIVTLSVNGGVSRARNLGLDMACGEYVSFLDADDNLIPAAWDHLAALTASRGWDIGVGDMEYTAKSKRTFHDVLDDDAYICNGTEALSDLLYQRRGWVSSVCNKIIHRRLLQQIRFRPDLRYEDMEILPRLLLNAGTVGLWPHAVYRYRDNPRSFINTWSEARLDALDVTAGHIDLMMRRCPALASGARARHVAAAFNILGTLVANGLHDHPATARCMAIITNLGPEVARDKKAALKLRLATRLSLMSRPMTRWLLKHKYARH